MQNGKTRRECRTTVILSYQCFKSDWSIVNTSLRINLTLKKNNKRVVIAEHGE